MANDNQQAIRKILSEARSAISESFHQYKNLMVVNFVGLFAVLVVLSVVGQLKFDSSLYFYSDVGTSGRFGSGAMTVVSGMCFFIGGALLVSCARLLYLHRGAAAEKGNAHRWFALAGLGIIYLGFDDIVMVHEYLTIKMTQIGVPKLFGIDQDVYIFAAYGIVALVAMIKLLPSVFHYRLAFFPLAAMVAFFVLSEAVDFIPWDSLNDIQRMILGPTEEILKTMGSWSAVLYAELLLENIVTEIGARSRK